MGELGEMGRVQIPRPRGDKLPFTCFISFYSPPSTRIQVYTRPKEDILHVHIVYILLLSS